MVGIQQACVEAEQKLICHARQIQTLTFLALQRFLEEFLDGGRQFELPQRIELVRLGWLVSAVSTKPIRESNDIQFVSYSKQCVAREGVQLFKIFRLLCGEATGVAQRLTLLI